MQVYIKKSESSDSSSLQAGKYAKKMDDRTLIISLIFKEESSDWKISGKATLTGKTFTEKSFDIDEFNLKLNEFIKIGSWPDSGSAGSCSKNMAKNISPQDLSECGNQTLLSLKSYRGKVFVQSDFLSPEV